jgi:hypothetical protein
MDLYGPAANAVSVPPAIPAPTTPAAWLRPLQSSYGSSVPANGFRQPSSGGSDPQNWSKPKCIVCMMSKKELMKKCSWLFVVAVYNRSCF